jgi:predicted glycogen debranching enzyme
MITLGPEICADLEKALSREWLVANGIGGYASSTITGANTRRYHALLVAALQPPVARTVLLAKIDERVSLDGRNIELGTNEYQGRVIHPSGYLHLQGFSLELGLPVFRYAASGFLLEKRIWTEYGHNMTYVSYRLLEAPRPVQLTLTLLANYRDHHAMTHGSPDWQFHVDPLPGGCQIVALPRATPYRVLTSPQADFVPDSAWYWRFQYRAEEERGLDHQEDLFRPGYLNYELAPGGGLTVAITAEEPAAVDLDGDRAHRREIDRRTELLSKVPAAETDDFVQQLVLAADQFLVSRGLPASAREARPAGSPPLQARTVIAGYPWFTDWGRDTMISLPGLTLATGRLAEARSILLTFAQYLSRGMLPNRFPDQGQAPEYNTVDATLWYFQAIDSYVQATKDHALLAELYPAMAEIVNWHVKGTRHGIAVDPADGLLAAGEEGVQLTWMDAKVGGWVVTPRRGKPVEINALWYNALSTMAEWSRYLGKPSQNYERLARRARASFERFWYPRGGYLYDVIDGSQLGDISLRPNQIIAVALPHSPLPPERAKAVVDVVGKELLTPYGLRTLATGHPAYIGRYRGNQRQRDAAYHQGTVWPWLLGPYVDAFLKVYGDRRAARLLLQAFPEHLAQAGLGTVSEIFEGNAPHHPVGCIAQAWSVAEILRAWLATESVPASTPGTRAKGPTAG